MQGAKWAIYKHSINWLIPGVLEQIQFATAIEDGTGRPVSPQGIQYYRSNRIRVFAGPILLQPRSRLKEMKGHHACCQQERPKTTWTILLGQLLVHLHIIHTHNSRIWFWYPRPREIIQHSLIHSLLRVQSSPWACPERDAQLILK